MSAENSDSSVKPESERYEIEEILQGVSAGSRLLVKVLGVTILVVLLALALAYPLVVT